jgi:hypothetical protein
MLPLIKIQKSLNLLEDCLKLLIGKTATGAKQGIKTIKADIH